MEFFDKLYSNYYSGRAGLVEFRRDAAENLGIVDSPLLDPIWSHVQNRICTQVDIHHDLHRQFDLFQDIVGLFVAMGYSDTKPFAEKPFDPEI